MSTKDYTMESPFWNGLHYPDAKFYCHCSCGEELPGTNMGNFLQYHYMNTPEAKDKTAELGRSNEGLKWTADMLDRQQKRMQEVFRNDPTIADRMSTSHLGMVRPKEDCDSISKGKTQFYKDNPQMLEVCEGNLDRVFSDSWIANMEKAWTPRRRLEWSERMLGEGNFNWKGGISGGKYGYGWSSVREIILVRDSFTCQVCGKIGSWTFEVHHIDSDIDNIVGTNLITLCSICHDETRNPFKKGDLKIFLTCRIEQIYSILG